MKPITYKILSPIFTSIFLLLLLRRAFIDSDAILQLILISLTVIISSVYLLVRYENSMIQIIMSLVALILIISGSFYIELLGIFLSGIPFIFIEKRDKIFKSLFITAMFFLLLILSGALRLQNDNGFYVFSIYDDIPKQYVPIIFYNGIVISLGRIVLTVSLLSLIIMGAASFFAVENTILILRNYKITSLSGAVQIIPVLTSCQCESSIGLSAFVATIFSILTLPLLFISLIFLIITNQILKGKIRMRNNMGSKFNEKLLIIMPLILLVSSLLIYLDVKLYLLTSMFFAGLMTILIIRAINKKINLGIKALLLGLVLQTISFSLFLTFINGFNIVNLILIIAFSNTSSVLIALYMGGNKKYEFTVYELYFTMWTMVFLVLVFLSQVISYNIIGSILESALIILLVSIPAMWISNIYNLRAFRLIRIKD
jgi:hypothetical protein